MKRLFTIILQFLFIGTLSFAQLTPQEMVQKMGRGINIGNVMEAMDEGNWQDPIEEYIFDDIKNAGFTSVRIPIRWDGHTGTSAPYTIDPVWLTRVEQVVDWSLARGLVTIINAHHEHWFTPNPEDPNNEARFKAIWTQVADHFQNKSDDLVFEIINEPYFDMSKAQVDAVNSYTLPIIRANNPTRKVILTGGGKNSQEAPLQIDPQIFAADNYLMAYFHYYQPFSFTSYAKDGYDQYTWGTATDKAVLDGHFDQVKDWSENYNIPILLGEFGADNICETASRIEYHRYVAEAAINRKFAFTAWCAGIGANKTIHNRSQGSWVEDVKNALVTAGTWGSADQVTYTNILLNPGYEEGISTNWSFGVSGAAVASNSDAGTQNAKTGNSAYKVNVTTADLYNKVLVKSGQITEGISSGTFTAHVYAKTTTPGAQFKLRVRAIDGAGASTYLTSGAFSLMEYYSKYSHTVDIPTGTAKIEVHFLCGQIVGEYYFDDAAAYYPESAPEQPVLTSIVVTPGTVSLEEGNTQQFTATGYDQNGDTIAINPTWSTDGGSIDVNGLYTASTAGTYTITAIDGSVNGTATVTISAIPVLTTITVTPGTASIEEDQSVQFSAEAFDQFGAPYATSFTWSTDVNATIDQTGLFTSSTAGSYTVTASAEGVDGTASATVTATTPPPAGNQLLNPGFELGVNTNWLLNVYGGAAATNDASRANNAYAGQIANEVKVTTAVNYGNVSVKSDIYAASMEGLTLNVSTWVKAKSNNQSFKIQVIFYDDLGNPTYRPSGAFNLPRNSYDLYAYSVEVPSGSVSFQIALQCGNVEGIYYFDEVSATLSTLKHTSLGSSQTEAAKPTITVYPIPARDYINIKSNEEIKQIELISISGERLIVETGNITRINVSGIPNGYYILKSITKVGGLSTTKIVITN
jgi:endoglucanase